VADYTLMLMPMAVRNAKSTIRSTDVRDYRLPDIRGRARPDDRRDRSGRIGGAVIDRLRGLWLSVLSHDRHPDCSAKSLSLEELIR
jgi:D-specific alpha-keto acid dehydrogenase